jgi:hypothetical protein
MILSKLDLLCLNSMSDDYEGISEIMKDVSKDIPGEVKKEDIITSIRRLVIDNDANVYVYDVKKQEFEIKPVNFFIDFDNRLIYFFLTEKGRKELDQQWDIVMGKK